MEKKKKSLALFTNEIIEKHYLHGHKLIYQFETKALWLFQTQYQFETKALSLFQTQYVRKPART